MLIVPNLGYKLSYGKRFEIFMATLKKNNQLDRTFQPGCRFFAPMAGWVGSLNCVSAFLRKEKIKKIGTKTMDFNVPTPDTTYPL